MLKLWSTAPGNLLLLMMMAQYTRNVLLNKHTVTVENQNYYEVVQPLLYITYCGFIYDFSL